jgi:hypothetical protein
MIVGLDVGITPDAELKEMGVPFFLDLMPDGEEKQAQLLTQSVQFYGRPFAMAPEAPKDRVDAVRKAFAATINDDAFVSDAKRANIQIQYADPQQILDYINIPFNAQRKIQERATIELRKAGWGGAAQ